MLTRTDRLVDWSVCEIDCCHCLLSGCVDRTVERLQLRANVHFFLGLCLPQKNVTQAQGHSLMHHLLERHLATSVTLIFLLLSSAFV